MQKDGIDKFTVVFSHVSKAKDPECRFSHPVCKKRKLTVGMTRGLKTADLKVSQQKKGTIK